MDKYRIIDELKKQPNTILGLSTILNIPEPSIRTALARLIETNDIIKQGTAYGYVYKLSETSVYYSKPTIVNTIPSEYKVAFEDLFKFFVEVSKDAENIISNTDKWNELWDKRDKQLIYGLGKSILEEVNK